MEEWVGQFWHRLVTRAARREYPQAAVGLDEVRQSVAVLFRALGGEGGLRVEAATESAHGARRNLIQRIAGSGRQVELAWRDEQTLRLPGRIAWFADRELNRQLYLWLAALAAVADRHFDGDWLQRNVAATAATLERYPGLARRYRVLVEAHLAQRPAPETLRADEAAQERLIHQCLLDPREGVGPLPAAARPPQPVPLWLHPAPPVPAAQARVDEQEDEEEDEERSPSERVESEKRRRGERVDSPDGRSGLLAFRLESLFSRAEYVAVDRTTEEDEDDNARSAIEDLDVLSMARDRKRTAARLRFDLDLPPEQNDDVYLGEGIPLPEWDFRQQTLLPDHCRLQPMLARDARPQPLPEHLQRKARRVRKLFEMLKPRRTWIHAQPDGSELDIDALIDHTSDRLRGIRPAEADLFRSFRNAERDLSCLLLADLSLSTDSHIDDRQRVIDVIRDSLFLFSEALAGTGDRFALYGFSSRHRSHVRFHTLKAFRESYSPQVKGRIQAIRPGYYTRMGAAVRYASRLLEAEMASHKLLLILTDGKPNDLDKYEGRYGIEDTRMAVREAARMGIRPFCVTIDEKARDYLPYLFGSTSYMLVHDAGQLPARLPALYARLTA
ncbi:MAG TPA: VWA domain-containing protein [Gammaproteobacteria bacterium]|nr:VWA domain-containing protein [Gammaproteobacteria bacterium]